jgi:hypothetical protein
MTEKLSGVLPALWEIYRKAVFLTYVCQDQQMIYTNNHWSAVRRGI